MQQLDVERFVLLLEQVVAQRYIDCQLRLAVRSPENGDTELLRVDKDRFTPIYVCGVFESCSPIRFHKDGAVYMVTNKGDRNFTEFVLYDLETGEEVTLQRRNVGLRRGLTLVFSDQGPGIADIELAMKDGYTTGTGMGLGLGGAKRLSNEFAIDSRPGAGTRVTITRWK